MRVSYINPGVAMSDIKRIPAPHLYDNAGFCNHCGIWREDAPEFCYFIPEADHVATVAAARVAGRKQGEQDQIDLTRDWGLHQHEVGRLQGQRDEREAAAQRVEGLPFLTLSPHDGDLAREQAAEAVREGDDDATV